MKEDHMNNGQLKPGYNVQIATENQFVIGYSIHQKAVDTTCLIPLLEKLKGSLGDYFPKTIVADAGYGSEENYEYLKSRHIDDYIKFGSYHQEEKRSFKKKIFRIQNFPYDPEKDEYTCPLNRKLKFLRIKSSKSINGFSSTIKIYECESCDKCALKSQCTKSSGNRRIEINENLVNHKKRVKEKLNSEKGIELRKRRSTDVESVFGHIKNCREFRRFKMRGLKKVNIEWGLLSLAQNFMKMSKIGGYLR